MKKYDAIVIGFGKGGKTLAGEMADHGLKVAMVEKSEQMYGGTCINIGCIPTKALIEQAQQGKQKGLGSWEEQMRAYRQAMEKKNQLTGALRQANFKMLDDREMVTVYNGEASFLSPNTLQVRLTDGETLELSAEKIFINTGSQAVRPDIAGAEDSPFVYNSTSLLELERLPEHLVIVGGGYIGWEYASMYRTFGSQVTVLVKYERFLPKEDPAIAEEVQHILEKQGITLIFNAKTERLSSGDKQAELTYVDKASGERRTLKADAVLLAAGRRPNHQGLNLEAAGVQVDEGKAIIVDEHLKTTAPNIWALGDVKGGPQFTYVSLDDYRIVRSALFGGKEYTLKERRNVPYSVFITPPLSHVGLTEEQAVRAGHTVKTAMMRPTNPKAKILGQTDGLLKAVVDSESGEILGCTLLCVRSEELINQIKLAMDAHLDYTFIRDQVFTHPTMSEVLNDLFALIK